MRTGDPIVGQESKLLLEREGRLQETYWTFIYAPLRDLDGRIDRVMALCNEVTEQRRRTEQLQLLWEAAAVLLTATDPDAMLRELFAKISPQFGLDTYSNYLVDDGGDSLRLISYAGIPAETARAIERLAFGQAICGTVALHRQPIVATHIQQSDDPKAQLVKSFGIQAYACNPLMSEGQLLGTLSFASRSRNEFDAAELAFLETICHYVTVAYERLRLLGQLREADRRKDEFLATLAHELRNPLAPIRHAVEILQLQGSPDPTVRAALDTIGGQVAHMVRLIDDLLDVSRITRGRLELRRQRVDLATVVAQALEASQPHVESAGHDLAVSLPPQSIHLDADPVRLAQVFMNLLHNACKYTEPGGRIRLTAERDGADVVVTVTDTGIGIPPNYLPRLFEMFSQAVPALERSQGGLGIGLALAKALLELHSGRIEAHSDGLGMGSAFVVRLPVLTETSSPPPPERQDGPQAVTPRRILVVDDNRISAQSFAMLLRLSGHEVEMAHDGLEAVQKAETYRPHVILLDIGLPKLNGYDACRAIRAQPWGQSIVLVAVTGWGQEDDRRQAQAAGFDGHVVKPVDRAALMKLLASSPSEAGGGHLP
jgi:signal transduction histidine kinase/ActR/RegA family two-component response regulator